jgi:hypothetical protein
VKTCKAGSLEKTGFQKTMALQVNKNDEKVKWFWDKELKILRGFKKCAGPKKRRAWAGLAG